MRRQASEYLKVATPLNTTYENHLGRGENAARWKYGAVKMRRGEKHGKRSVV